MKSQLVLIVVGLGLTSAVSPPCKNADYDKVADIIVSKNYQGCMKDINGDFLNKGTPTEALVRQSCAFENCNKFYAELLGMNPTDCVWPMYENLNWYQASVDGKRLCLQKPSEL